MSVDRRTLVVGTTGDYIDWIVRNYPGRALFLTDVGVRIAAREATPDPADELLADLGDYDESRLKLQNHLNARNQELSGIACFDDESLELAASLAMRYSLAFTPIESIQKSRCKFTSRNLWSRSGLSCAWFCSLSFNQIGRSRLEVPFPCIVKPLTGSGSELVFRCSDSKDLSQALLLVRDGLKKRQASRMYSAMQNRILIEEYIEGPEFSCDFTIDSGRLKIIRIAGKILSEEVNLTGTAEVYHIPAILPDGIDRKTLEWTLYSATGALGINKAICMADFIVRNGEIVLLEISPRPGGDCLPGLLRFSGGIDMLGFALQYADRNGAVIPDEDTFKPMAALRIRSNQAGIFHELDINKLQSDTRVKEIEIYRSKGDRIQLPPEDYSSWLIGHVIFEPRPSEILTRQVQQLKQMIKIVLEPQGNEQAAEI